MPKPIPIAVLIGGSGTTLQNLIDRIAAGTLNAQIVTVIASRPGIFGIERAKQANLSCHVAPLPHGLFDLCAPAQLVCLAGWMSLLDIPATWDGKIMNIHPALLPSFGGKGMYGRRVHQAVLDHGCKVSGCTVHFVNRDYDNGPIILQRTCPVLEDDTAQSLAHRVFEEEKIAYPQAIDLFRQGRLNIQGRHVRID